MKYKNIIKGKFIDRPNRFIAHVEIEGKVETVHVKNTGRCKELLVPNATIYLEDFKDNMRKRKLRFDLISVEKEIENGEVLLVNMDSQVPNKVVLEGLKEKSIVLPYMDELEEIRPETTYMDSRFDFYVRDINGKEGFIEVKGVTLEENKVCRFPDAITDRGKKHMLELINAKNEGYLTYALFLVQMNGMKYFTTADDHDIEFGKALRLAKNSGVNILVYECKVDNDCIIIDKEIESRF